MQPFHHFCNFFWKNAIWATSGRDGCTLWASLGVIGSLLPSLGAPWRDPWVSFGVLACLLGCLLRSCSLPCVALGPPGANFGLSGSVLGRPRAPWWTAGHIMHTTLMCFLCGFLDYMRLVFPFNCVAYVGGGRVGMDRTSFCVRDTLIDFPPTPRPRKWGEWAGEAPHPLLILYVCFWI